MQHRVDRVVRRELAEDNRDGVAVLADVSNVVEERIDHLTVRGVHDVERDVDAVLLPAPLELAAGAVDRDVERPEVAGDVGLGVAQNDEQSLVEVLSEDDDMVLALAHEASELLLHVLGRNLSGFLGLAVVMPDEEEHEDDHRDDDENHPCTTGELGDGDDDAHESRRDRTHDVDDGRREPPLLALPEVVDDHSALRESERREDADRIERDECARLGAERQDEHHGGERENHDAVAEHQTVSQLLESAGEEVVGRDERGEAGEVRICGVRCENQDAHRRERQRVVHEAVSVELTRYLADDGLGLAGVHARMDGEPGEPEEQYDQDAGHEGQGPACVLPLRKFECLNTVGDGLDARHRGTAR